MWSVLLSFALFFSLIGTVFAQSVGDLYSKSVQAGSDYRQKYSTYLVNKNQNLQYQTAATKLAALDASKNVLQARNAWQIAYLTYLRSYLAQTTNIANYSQTVVYLDLETEITNLNASQNVLGSGDTVDIVNKNAADWEKRLTISDKLVNAATTQITSTKLADLQKQLQVLVDAKQSADATTLNLIKQKLQNSIDLRTAVDTSLRNYKDNYWSVTSAKAQLAQSRQALLEAATLLEQIR